MLVIDNEAGASYWILSPTCPNRDGQSGIRVPLFALPCISMEGQSISKAVRVFVKLYHTCRARVPTNDSALDGE